MIFTSIWNHRTSIRSILYKQLAVNVFRKVSQSQINHFSRRNSDAITQFSFPNYCRNFHNYFSVLELNP